MLSSGKKLKKKDSASDSPNQDIFTDAKPKPKKSIAFSDVIDVVSPIETSDCAKAMSQRREDGHSRVAFLPRTPATKPQKFRASKSQRIVPPPLMPSRLCHNSNAHPKELMRGMSEADNCSCACHSCSCCLYHGTVASSRDHQNDPYHRSPYFRGSQYSDLDLYEFDADTMATLRGAIDDILSNRMINKLLGSWNTSDSMYAGSRSLNMSAERKLWCPNRDKRSTSHTQTTYAQTDCLHNIYACLNEIRQTLRKSRSRD